MNCKDGILQLIAELARLFENNKSIYRQLMNMRHLVNNKMSLTDLESVCQRIIETKIDAIKNRNMMQLLSLLPELDIIWRDLSKQNRFMVWKWIDSILDATPVTHNHEHNDGECV